MLRQFELVEFLLRNELIPDTIPKDKGWAYLKNSFIDFAYKMTISELITYAKSHIDVYDHTMRNNFNKVLTDMGLPRIEDDEGFKNDKEYDLWGDSIMSFITDDIVNVQMPNRSYLGSI